MENNKYLYNFSWLFILFLCITACEKEAGERDESGYILLGVEKNEILYTKAGEPIKDEVLGVYFINTVTNDTTKQFENYKQEVEGQRILLPAATYDIRISSATTDEPAWDTPVYYADTTLTIKAGEIVSAALECKITNTKVTVDFTQNVATYFSYYEAVVAGKSGELTFVMDETRAGFYSTDKFTVTLNLVNKNNGIPFQFVKVFPDIQPRYHYKLKFDTSDSEEEAAGGNIDVTINDELDEVEYTIKLPKYTQLQDMPKAPVTKIETRLLGEQTDSESSSLTFKKVEGENIVDKHQLVISTQAGLKNLYMNLSPAFVEESLPEMFDWLTVNESVKNKIQISGSFDSNNLIYTLDLKNMINNYLRSNESSSRTYLITISALDVYQQEIQIPLTYTVMPDLDIMTYEVNTNDIWGKQAILRGFCDPTGSNLYFKYGTNPSSETWTERVTASFDDSIGNVSAIVTGLTPGTTYYYKLYGTLISGDEEGERLEFTTDGEAQLPNSSFENWQEPVSGRNYWLVHSSNEEKFWDTGNDGATTISSSSNLTIPVETYVVDGNFTAQLSSRFVGLLSLGRFAAGNMFTGSYLETIGASTITNAGGILEFGREFTSRPTKLKGWYKYTAGTIDYIDSNITIPQELIDEGARTGETDKGHIYIALSDKGAPYRIINTTAGGNEINLFDKNDEHIIAYGELVQHSSTLSQGLENFEITLNYRSLDRRPTHIIIVCSASKYGDYFSGSTGSTLWIDNFELIYE